MQNVNFFYAYLTIYLNSSLYPFSLIIVFIGSKMMKHNLDFPYLEFHVACERIILESHFFG